MKDMEHELRTIYTFCTAKKWYNINPKEGTGK